MDIIHDISKEVINVFEKYGIVMDEIDGSRYYNLPQWFKKDVNGVITEILFNDLPDSAKHIHLGYRDYQRVFSLKEMKACALAMVNYGEGFTNSLTPTQYFKQVLGIDITEQNK